MRTDRIVFLKELLTKGSKASPPKSGMPIQNGTGKSHSDYRKPIGYIQDIPDYMQSEAQYLTGNRGLLKVRTLQGYCLDLNAYNNFEDYLEKQFGAKSRSNLRRHTRRLEECFPIRYKFYSQSIPEEEYNSLFKHLGKFLILRFQEKGEHNYELAHIQDLQTDFDILIRQGKATIFVIYDGDRPINIRLNAIHEKQAFYIISGYDIDYSKFQLGNLDMMKNIEWCFQNDISKYDLLKGYGYYKKKWVSQVYDNYDYILYPEGAPFPNLRAILLFSMTLLRYRLLENTKRFGLHKFFKHLKRWFFQRGIKKSNTYQFREENVAGFQKGELIDLEVYSELLKRPVYEFLYLNREYVGDIKIFSSLNEPLCYLIEGKKASGIFKVISSEKN